MAEAALCTMDIVPYYIEAEQINARNLILICKLHEQSLAYFSNVLLIVIVGLLHIYWNLEIN